jgi:Skp family chaperone for outer membrane proteins
MKPIRLTLCAVLAASAMPARAIELSLEENRAERGSVGYVDMQRLFKASPDATRAREGLEELVRQAEERVNGRKAELLKLRQDLSTLKIEREELAKSTPTATVAPTAPAPKPEPVALPVPAKPLAPTPAPKPVEPPKPAPKPAAPEPPPVTAAPPPPLANPEPPARPEPAPLMINLPGLTDGPLNLERPGSSPLNPTKSAAPVAEPAPAPAPAPAPVPAPAPEPAAPVLQTEPPPVIPAEVKPAEPPKPAPLPEPVPPPAPAPAGPTVAQRLLELDGQIVGKQAEIDRVQSELDKERLGAERSLLDAEGRKTDQVLARLYRAISEVAKREGVSVVVEKSATLYGHPAVDLTDKVLRQLRGAVPAQ